MLPNRDTRFRQVLSVAALVGALILCAIPLAKAAEAAIDLSSCQASGLHQDYDNLI